MKKILVFSAYYEPEVAASLYLSTNLYEDMARNKYKVELFVPMPTRGVDKKTRNYYKKHKIEKKGNLTIHRVSLMEEKKGTISRALRYLLMNLIFVWKGIITKADVIFVQSTPPTQGAMAAVIKKIKKIPFVYNLQDVFPDSMVNMGMTNEGSIIYKIGRIVENFTYKNADKVIVISDDIKKNIMKKGVKEDKISVVSNWVETDNVYPIEKKNNYMFEKYNLDKDYFYIVYAGNLGYAQNIELMIKAAKRMRGYDKIKFLIFGKGAQEKEYKELAKKLRLDNLSFYPIQPYSEVSYVYSLGDVCVVSCKKGFGGSAMPSKTWNIMATKTPIIASFDSQTEMEKLVQTEKVGLFSDADNEEKFIENILTFYNDREKLKEYGENALHYVKNNRSRNVCVAQYMDIISKIKNC